MESSCSLCRLVFTDRDSRNLFFFLLINFSFAIVELVYGIWTNSLGLISDSFHMFFDCLALVTGLVASVITKNPPNEKFTYGFAALYDYHMIYIHCIYHLPARLHDDHIRHRHLYRADSSLLQIWKSRRALWVDQWSISCVYCLLHLQRGV